ncbi:uncharacterized protein LOC114533384 [Dendronephthya gigantea]|uniref:uncharacterized protein LOC114533384 n=1 Tax=Dendronephthya gigantea TaxID=151771 RepID=UPI00106A25E1|nr:uncharacterized protein LOC114533384 [Dendronephthya gigantea]
MATGKQCLKENPKPGDFHPNIELEVITKDSYPQNNGSHVTVRCKATAPVLNSKLYNPALLNPTVIFFFFNENHVPVQNCPPSSGSPEKICELVIPKFGQANNGKYYCMARNEIRCTIIGAHVPSNPCPAPGEKEKLALDSFHNNLLKTMKCLKDYTLCCITGSMCDESYQQCLHSA